MTLAGQLAKLLTKSAKGLMSSSEPLQHYPVLRVLTPEQEAMFAHRPESSYTEQSLLPIDQPPIEEMDVVPPVREEISTLPIQGKKEQEIIRRTINEPLYHTSRSPENIETFDLEIYGDKAKKGNVSSGMGAYFTPSLEYSRGIYYSRIVPEEIQTKYINKGEAHKIWDAEKLYRRGEFSPEEIEDLVYDAHTYKAKLKEDFNPIVILGKKDKTNKLNTLTSEERADFIRRNPSYQDGSPIIKHKGIWKSQQELEEIGFEGVIDASEKFKHVDEKGISKHEVVVWPSALSKISHELMRGIGAREGIPTKKRINVKTASREEIKEHYKISTEDKDKAKEAARDAELEEAAKRIKAGTNKKEEAVFGVNKNKTWDGLVKEKNPISIITDMPTVPSAKVIDAVLQPTQAKKGILVQVEKGKEIEGLTYKDPSTIANKIVSARIDINARNNFGIWVDTIHEPKPDGSPGKVIGYTNSVYLKDVTFHTPDLEIAQDKALDIAMGKSKNPFAGMTGTFINKTLKENYKLTKKALDQQNKPQGMKPLPHLEWVQIGMNPKRASYFYDKKTGEPILRAKEVVQVGELVFARGVERGKASDFTFEEGGVVDMRHGGRVGAAVVAASLMASGGQTMDMRDGGRVGMQGGGMTTLIPLQSGETPPIPKEKPYILDINIPEEKQFTADPKEVFVQAALNMIAEGEGTGDKGYDIPFGYGKYVKPKIKITDMTLKELDRFQVQQIHATKNQGIEGLYTDTKNPDESHGTSAVGKYQITRGVITDAVNAGIVNRNERFTPEVQERIARFLLNRSGLESMLSGKMSPKDYREKLSKVWASIEGSKAGQPIKTSAKELENLFTVATNNLLP